MELHIQAWSLICITGVIKFEFQALGKGYIIMGDVMEKSSVQIQCQKI